MLYPSIYSLLEKVDNSRYKLVILTSKRARQIVDGRKVLINTKADSPVTIAVNEIDQEKIGFTNNN